jgi:lipopolysaccharide/colanic/teichoic acid biosynthesis glycosyltransferase
MKYVEQYCPEFRATLLLPAGITSEASIRFKSEDKWLREAESADRIYLEEILPKKMQWNLESIRKFSFLREIWIMFRTIAAVCGRDHE